MAEDAKPEFTPEEEEILNKIVEQKEESFVRSQENVEKYGEQQPENGVEPEQPKDLTLTPERVRALKRAKVPEAVLAKFADSPEQLSEWADTLMEMQGSVDGYSEKMRHLEEQVAAQGNQPESDTTRTAEPSSAPDDSEPTEVAETEDKSPELEAANQLQSTPDRSQKLLVETLIGEIAKLRIDEALASYDDVTDRERAHIAERMTSLYEGSPGEFNGIEGLAKRAVTEVMGVPKSEHADRSTSVDPARVSTAPRGTSVKSERPLTPDEADDIALDIILRGGTKEDAKRATMR
jgi:hypothetical protein|tara:strand:- start:710 stop:1588 length:879 start_codon:yes stop_codon:yes gene_type:complete